MLRVVILFIVLCFTFGNSAVAALVPSDIKQVVNFIYIKKEDGKLSPNGTGFLVSVKEENTLFVYLVTAKHVLMQDGKYHPAIFVRQNTKDGTYHLASGRV